MMGYLANTVIFVLVGVVVTEQALNDVSAADWVILVALYLGLPVIRGITFAALSPVLARIGYGVSWRSIIIMTWGGLRGAVGLLLALIVVRNSAIDTATIGSKILFHTAGIVVLTLLINATTVGRLLKLMGMSEVPEATRYTLSVACKHIETERGRFINALRNDKFLAGTLKNKNKKIKNKKNSERQKNKRNC